MVKRQMKFSQFSTLAVWVVTLTATPALAQSGGREAQIVVDGNTNEVLYENNAQALRRPASITKVMTLYLLFDALKQGKISWNDRISFSQNASNQPPTKLSVRAGGSIPIQTAVEALVLRSANDVATAVAENLAGSEANFANLMTQKARELGMGNTTFRNASGLPHEAQRTTAEDLAKLAIAIHRDFPDQYHWFSAQQMSWNGQIITGHNHLIKRMPGMDGLKTGYTRLSGFNLAATTQRGGRRIVTVVLGGSNRFERDDLVEQLTESAFRNLGRGAPQFALNTIAYDYRFADSRDAADAAALIMDGSTRVGAASRSVGFAMAGTGRQLQFDRSSSPFQIADMSRTNGPTGGTRTYSDEGASGSGDEGEDDSAQPVTMAAATKVKALAAMPVRVAQQALAKRTPKPVPVPVPVPASVPVSVPVVFASATPAQTSPAPASSIAVASLRGRVDGATVPSGSNTDIVQASSFVNQTRQSQNEGVAASPNAPADTPATEVAQAQSAPPQMEAMPSTQLAQINAAQAPEALNGTINLSGGPVLAQTEPMTPISGSTAPAMADVQQPAPTPALGTQMAELGTTPEMGGAQSQTDAPLSSPSSAQAPTETAVPATEVPVAARAMAQVSESKVLNQRQEAARQRILARQKAQKDKEAKAIQLAEKNEQDARARAASQEKVRQSQALAARGQAIVQVGAFKRKTDASAAITQFARYFPTFAQQEVTSVSRHDGVWYRARFAGLGAMAAKEACTMVVGRGGACQIVNN
jgi:D-alanyl-D-alanine carboxypeptidase